MSLLSDYVKISEFPLSSVKIEQGFLKNAFEKEVKYLLSLDSDRLLAGFRDNAGVDMKGKTRYQGWESLLIGGHTLGHYLSACVNCYESGNATEEQRERLLSVIEYCAVSLKKCQDALGTGLIFGAEILDRDNIELQFDNVERNKSELFHEAWVPWYTMHKIICGLVSMAQIKYVSDAESGGNERNVERVRNVRIVSKTVVSRLADWVYGRTSSWNAETHAVVLGIEYGGMNDCLYDVYQLTGKPEHLLAAKAFDEVTLYERIFEAEKGDNALNDLHANTTIPKFMGALKHYTVTGETEYLGYAEKFWKLVTEEHTYITGGNSEWEHFGFDGILNAERTNCNCETCNSYNMLKLTKLLFEITGDVKYSDWYEGTFFNSILSSQNPETGMTTYFQPMASGYFKTYGEPDTKFWCCVGSGMENFSKLGESLYFHKGSDLIVNQYISSGLKCDDLSLVQKSGLPSGNQTEFIFETDFSGRVYFRLPWWLAGDAVILRNGEKYEYSVADADGELKGYALIEGDFSAGTCITLVLPMKITAHNLPDSENTYAFKYGPVLLSALLGTDEMDKTTTGVDVTIPEKAVFPKRFLPGENEVITVKSGAVDDFIGDINSHLVRQEGAALAADSWENLRFVLKDTDSGLVYVPHYSQYRERYGIYFEFRK